MPVKILINGISGKMGNQTQKALEKFSEFSVVGLDDSDRNLTSKIKRYAADIVIDFTHAKSVFENTAAIIEAGVHPIIGTSGLVKSQIDILQKRARDLKLGGIIAPNFSLGVILMIQQAKEIKHYFSDVEIIEMHHQAKKDSPSGTALYAADMLAAINPPSLPSDLTESDLRETIKGSRGANYNNIPIHAIRLPGILANLEIIFGGLGETITLRHDTLDRQCYMPGVLLACKKVQTLSELVYGLENIL